MSKANHVVGGRIGVQAASTVPALNHYTLLFLIPAFHSFFKKLCIYLWLCWVFIAALGVSLVAECEGCSQVAVLGLLIVVASLVGEHRLLAVGASVAVAPRLLSLASVVVAHGLSCFSACGILLG